MSQGEIAYWIWENSRTALDMADPSEFYSVSSRSGLQENLRHRIKQPLVWPDESPVAIENNQRRGHICPNSKCAKRFSRKADLKRHLHAHDPSWHYQCAVESCERFFSRKDKLMLHVRNVHGFNPSAEMLKASKHPIVKGTMRRN